MKEITVGFDVDSDADFDVDIDVDCDVAVDVGFDVDLMLSKSHVEHFERLAPFCDMPNAIERAM